MSCRSLRVVFHGISSVDSTKNGNCENYKHSSNLQDCFSPHSLWQGATWMDDCGVRRHSFAWHDRQQGIGQWNPWREGRTFAENVLGLIYSKITISFYLSIDNCAWVRFFQCWWHFCFVDLKFKKIILIMKSESLTNFFANPDISFHVYCSRFPVIISKTRSPRAQVSKFGLILISTLSPFSCSLKASGGRRLGLPLKCQFLKWKF